MEHEIINATCPECSPDEPVEHTIVKERPGLLIKCSQCQAVNPHFIKKETTKHIRVVVSTGDTSVTRMLELGSDELISKDDEFIVEDETGEHANFVIVTSIESDGKRVNDSKADKIQTVWARSTDKVMARISVTRGWQTQSFEMEVPGDHQFTVGETIIKDQEKFLIKSIKEIEGRSLQKKGDSAMAKHIKRIYTDSEERLEWLNRPKKTHKKGSRSVMGQRGSATWTLKRKENG